MTRSQSASASNVVVPDRFAERRVAASAVTFPFATPSSRNLRMRAEPFVQERLIDLAHDRLVARRRAHLRDAGAHQPAAQHTDGLDLHLASLL